MVVGVAAGGLLRSSSPPAGELSLDDGDGRDVLRGVLAEVGRDLDGGRNGARRRQVVTPASVGVVGRDEAFVYGCGAEGERFAGDHQVHLVATRLVAACQRD